MSPAMLGDKAMSRARKMVFWWSVVGALIGLGAFYALGLNDVVQTPLASGDSTEAAEQEGAAASEEEAPAAEEAAQGDAAIAKADEPQAALSPALIFCLIVFGAIPFTSAWHGSSVQASGDAVAASALWGLIPAILVAACGWGAIALFLWSSDVWNFEILKATALPIAMVAGAAWEIGFVGVMPFVSRAEGA